MTENKRTSSTHLAYERLGEANKVVLANWWNFNGIAVGVPKDIRFLIMRLELLCLFPPDWKYILEESEKLGTVIVYGEVEIKAIWMFLDLDTVGRGLVFQNYLAMMSLGYQNRNLF